MITHLVELLSITPVTNSGRKVTKTWHVFHEKIMMNTDSDASFEGKGVAYLAIVVYLCPIK